MARIESLYLFSGENTWEKNEAFKRLKQKLFPEKSSAVSCHIIEGKEKDFHPEKVLSDLKTIPFVSTHHLFLIRDIEKTPSTFQFKLLDIAQHLPQGVVCVLETQETKLYGEFFEKIVRMGKLVVFKMPKGNALFSWLDQRAQAYQKKLDQAAKRGLLEKLGEELPKLDKALQTLALYVGERGVITEEDVQLFMGASLTHTSFELARAIASRRPLVALKMIDRLFAEKETPQEIVGAVGWQLRRMLRAKELLEEGTSPTMVKRQVRLRWDEENVFFESLSRFERSEIERGLQALLRADQRLKTGLGEGREEVEHFVLGLCR